MDRPIIFNGEMVRAILDGKKTQSRRPVRPQPMCEEQPVLCDDGLWRGRYRQLCYDKDGGVDFDVEVAEFGPCPFGKPGDTLWVKETFFVNYHKHEWPRMLMEQLLGETYYRADGIPDFDGEEGDMCWQPSMHMPRWASRLSSKVTDVRVERLQEISRGDIDAEGTDMAKSYELRNYPLTIHQLAYADLWDSIYAKHGLGWEANPWVWVVSFEVNP